MCAFTVRLFLQLTADTCQLLNFPDWSTFLTTGLEVTCRDKNKSGPELKPGDRLRANFRGTVVKPKVLVRDISLVHCLASRLSFMEWQYLMRYTG